MSQSLNTPLIQIENLKTKFDTVVVSNSLIALLDYDYNEAIFLQQLHYWSYSQYEVVIDGIRWIYKSAKEWLSEALVGLTEWKLRKAISSLLEKNIIRREKLFARHQEQEYNRFWWQPKNQTYYYSINYEELEKLIEKATSTEDVWTTQAFEFDSNDVSFRFKNPAKLSFEEFNQTKSCELSQNITKNTNYKELTSKQSTPRSENTNTPSSAAAEPFVISEKGTAKKDTFLIENKLKKSSNRKTQRNNKNVSQVGQLINKNSQKQIQQLDQLGIKINPTLAKLIRSYTQENFESAIALVKSRKREKYIPNLAEYFTKALKQSWADEESGSSQIDTADLYKYWYDLARELGYCSGQEMRDGEQWVCLSGSWEKWSDAVTRGYSIDYHKKILKRNGGRS